MKSMNLIEKLWVKPGTKVRLRDYDPDATPGCKVKPDVDAVLLKTCSRLAELQYLMYAENKRALLIVLQAPDTGGKDGTIRHVMTGLNPAGVQVKSFKVPTDDEGDHDYLWRIHHAVPNYGEFGIFNRSHYEDVIVVRVHDLVPRSVWGKRYDEINAFEKHLTENNVVILKFFLHITKAEQKKRLLERIEDKRKWWKLSDADFSERTHWNEYEKAYEDVLTRCSTKEAPWFIIPANRKWFRNLAVAEIMLETLESLNMKFPKPKIDPTKVNLR